MTRRRNSKNIYFGKNSYFKAVRDVGRKGVDTPRELLLIASSQLCDLVDLQTISRRGRREPWVLSPRERRKGKGVPWTGRTLVLWRLYSRISKKLSKREAQDLKKKLRLICETGKKILLSKPKMRERIKIIKETLRKIGLSRSEISRLLKKTN